MIVTKKFTNSHGDEWVFEYDSEVGEGILKGSDIDWESYPCRERSNLGLILNSEEREWLEEVWTDVHVHARSWSNEGVVSRREKTRVRDYWRDKPETQYFNPDWDETNWSCFACGIECGGYIDSAHIRPRKRGEVKGVKPGTENNIHLLCRVCHTESEGLLERAYWHWLHLKSMVYNKGNLENILLRDPYLPSISIDDVTYDCYAVQQISTLIKTSREHIHGASNKVERYYTTALKDREGNPIGPEMTSIMIGDEDEC